jgi:hypothetical protein
MTPARRALSGLAALSLTGALIAACPAREIRVEVTPKGVERLILSCEGASVAACDVECCRSVPPGTPDHPPPDPTKYTEARLFLLSLDGDVKDASRCMDISPCSTSDMPQDLDLECIAAKINQQLAGAMPDGLTFDDFEDPADARLFLAIYQPPPGAAPCDPEELVLCAGFAETIGEGVYDIACASCQGGRNQAAQFNTACPTEGNGAQTRCFLRTCDALLRSAPPP